MKAELIFGKSLYEVSYSDFEEFFSEEQEESSILEFKSGDVSIDKIYKEVCAFLNTEGGVLIIGTPEEDKPDGRAICQGKPIPSKNRGKDRLMTSIVSNISPPPTDIRIHEIHSDEGSHFIVDVPQSLMPPHQNSRDGRYYIRMEGIASHAPHGVVEALFQKRQRGKVAPHINLVSLGGKQIEIRALIENLSPYPADKVSYSLSAYNIVQILPKPNQNIGRNLDGTLTIGHTFPMVLWKGLDFVNSHVIQHGPEPFFISLTAWSQDAELSSTIGVFIGVSEIERERYDATEKKGREYYIDLVKKFK